MVKSWNVYTTLDRSLENDATLSVPSTSVSCSTAPVFTSRRYKFELVRCRPPNRMLRPSTDHTAREIFPSNCAEATRYSRVSAFMIQSLLCFSSHSESLTAR